MGFGMAKNIRKKIPQQSALIIFDVNTEAMDRLVKEFGDNSDIIQAKSAKEVAEMAVCTRLPILPQNHWQNRSRGLIS